MEHDVLAFVHGIGAKLSTRSRHVCAVLGAGAGRSCGLPDISGLQRLIVGRLQGDEGDLVAQQLEHRNLEELLSRLRQIAALLEQSATDETVDGLNADQARRLDAKLCTFITDALEVDQANLSPMLSLATWLGSSDYHWPVEIFTVNYDLLIETALEQRRVPYFDGFVGALHAPFRPELVEAQPGDEDWLPRFLSRIWKLHGSVNWVASPEPGGEVVRLGSASGSAPAAIYPSETKYDESRRMPFVVLQDRFRRALNQEESLTLICGYSFGDDHLNETIFDAAQRRPRNETIVFCYGALPDSVAGKAELIPNLQVLGRDEAVIGRSRGPWRALDEPADGIWDQGLLLGDFQHLAAFLARSAGSRHGVASVAGDVPVALDAPGD